MQRAVDYLPLSPIKTTWETMSTLILVTTIHRPIRQKWAWAISKKSSKSKIIPVNIGHLSYLIVLVLSRSDWHGTIPEGMRGWIHLDNYC